MSLTEIKEQVAGLSRRDRFRLSAFLDELEQSSEGEFRDEVDRGMEAMDAGRKVTAAEFEKREGGKP